MNKYSTTQVAEFLGTDRKNVTFYITQGYLRAVMVGSYYEITHEDYVSFREEYYDNGKRHSNRGAKKSLTPEHIKSLAFMLSDLQNSEIDFFSFQEKYTKYDNTIQNIKDYIKYKRDICIRHDKDINNYKNIDLCHKYALSERMIYKIINEREL